MVIRSFNCNLTSFFWEYNPRVVSVFSDSNKWYQNQPNDAMWFEGNAT